MSATRSAVTPAYASAPYGWAALLSLLAVLYLTLLPFEFGDVAVAEAWQRFLAMEQGAVRSGARQQWVANALMFMPLGFFLTAWLTLNRRSGLVRLLLGMVVAAFCLLVTASVEFAQIWLPNRNPSLNDISANFVGGAVGATVWVLIGRRIAAWWDGVQREGLRINVTQLLLLYGVFYIVVSLLPFDFLLSLSELQARLASEHWSWWMRADYCTETQLRCLALDGSKVVLAVPLGVWLYQRYHGQRLVTLFVTGLALGLGVEAAQFLLVTGRADGFSGLLRVMGIGTGLLLAAQFINFAIHIDEWRQQWGRVLAIGVCIPYTMAVFAVGLGNREFHWEAAQAWEQLQSLRWLPFYYHYFVAEAVAIRSVLLTLMLYAPLGGILWLWAGNRTIRPLSAVALGAVFALTIEAVKLFIDGQRPDLTSVWLGGLAAWAAWRVCTWATVQFGAGHSVSPPLPKVTRVSAPSRLESASLPARVLGITLLALTLILAMTWPVAAPWLVMALVAYMAWLWHRPEAWLLVIPALVPTLNLSLYTGRFFFDELDLFLLATLAVHAVHWRSGWGLVPLPRLVRWSLFAVGLAFFVSLVRGLLPLQPLDDNALVHYASHYNALRDAKGFVWALVLFMLLNQSSEPLRLLFQRWLVPGMVLGLVGVVAIILWERATYPGLFDFASRYRLSALFTEMHVGGPSIETYLVLTLPFALLWAGLQRSWLWWIPLCGLLAAALYGLVVTYSRAGYLGMAVVLLVILAGALITAVTRRGAQRWQLTAVVMVLFMLVGSVLPRVTGDFFAQRLEQLDSDFARRTEHWQLVMALREPGVVGTLLGAGLGAFPRTYVWGNPQGQIPANFSYVHTSEGHRLRIGTGDSLFINQRLSLPPHGDYTVEVKAQSDQTARLGLFVCEKFVRHSFECRRTAMEIAPPGTGDNSSVWIFNADGLATGPWFQRRQLVFSFSNSTAGSIIDIEQIRLTAADGQEFLRNGDFSQGGRYWYFTTDNLWPWRTENQWLEIFFAQGWLGLLAFVALTLLGLITLLRRAAQGAFEAIYVLAALAGMLAIGVFSTVFWSPRLTMLFYLVLLLGVAVAHDSLQQPTRRRLRRAYTGTIPDHR